MSLAAALVTFASACATTGQGDGCAVFRPIYLEAADVDVISESAARAVLAHNETGREVCGW